MVSNKLGTIISTVVHICYLRETCCYLQDPQCEVIKELFRLKQAEEPPQVRSDVINFLNWMANNFRRVANKTAFTDPYSKKVETPAMLVPDYEPYFAGLPRFFNFTSHEVLPIHTIVAQPLGYPEEEWQRIHEDFWHCELKLSKDDRIQLMEILLANIWRLKLIGEILHRAVSKRVCTYTHIHTHTHTHTSTHTHTHTHTHIHTHTHTHTHTHIHTHTHTHTHTHIHI